MQIIKNVHITWSHIIYTQVASRKTLRIFFFAADHDFAIKQLNFTNEHLNSHLSVFILTTSAYVTQKIEKLGLVCFLEKFLQRERGQRFMATSS